MACSLNSLQESKRWPTHYIMFIYHRDVNGGGGGGQLPLPQFQVPTYAPVSMLEATNTVNKLQTKIINSVSVHTQRRVRAIDWMISLSQKLEKRLENFGPCNESEDSNNFFFVSFKIVLYFTGQLNPIPENCIDQRSNALLLVRAKVIQVVSTCFILSHSHFLELLKQKTAVMKEKNKYLSKFGFKIIVSVALV